jgi:hypothetical protein
LPRTAQTTTTAAAPAAAYQLQQVMANMLRCGMS